MRYILFHFRLLLPSSVTQGLRGKEGRKYLQVFPRHVRVVFLYHIWSVHIRSSISKGFSFGHYWDGPGKPTSTQRNPLCIDKYTGNPLLPDITHLKPTKLCIKHTNWKPTSNQRNLLCIKLSKQH